MLAVNLDVGDVVLKNSWYVDLEKNALSTTVDNWGSGVAVRRPWPQHKAADDTDLWECSFRKNDQQTSLYWNRNRQQLFLVNGG